MFYAAELLTKGPLKLIWKASHLDSRHLNKSQIMEVNVVLTVKEIEELSETPAPAAFRTSSQLLYGVARIFSRQVEYLWQDASHAQARLISAGRSMAATKGARKALLPEGQSTAPLDAITLPEHPVELLLSPEDLQDMSLSMSMPFDTYISLSSEQPSSSRRTARHGSDDAGPSTLRFSFGSPGTANGGGLMQSLVFGGGDDFQEDELLEPLPHDLSEMDALEEAAGPGTPHQQQQGQEEQQEQMDHEEQQGYEQQEQQEEQQPEQGPGAASEELASPTKVLRRSTRGTAASSDATGGGGGAASGSVGGAVSGHGLPGVARRLDLSGVGGEGEQDQQMQEEADGGLKPIQEEGEDVQQEEAAAAAHTDAPATPSPSAKRTRTPTTPSPRAKRAHTAAWDALPDGTPNTTLSSTAVRALLMDRSPLLRSKGAVQRGRVASSSRRSSGGRESSVLLLGLPVGPPQRWMGLGLPAATMAPELRALFEVAVGMAPTAGTADGEGQQRRRQQKRRGDEGQQGVPGDEAAGFNTPEAAGPSGRAQEGPAGAGNGHVGFGAADVDMEEPEPLQLADPFGYGQLHQQQQGMPATEQLEPLPETELLQQQEEEQQYWQQGQQGWEDVTSGGGGAGSGLTTEDSLATALLMAPGTQEAEEAVLGASGQVVHSRSAAAAVGPMAHLSPRARQVLHVITKRAAAGTAADQQLQEQEQQGSDSTEAPSRATRSKQAMQQANGHVAEGAPGPQPVSLQQLVQGKGRLAAARCFYELMVLQTRGCVALEQKEPYGDVEIAVRPGMCA